MNSPSRHSVSLLGLITATSLLLVASIGCSSKAKKAGAHLAEANRYYSSGDFEKAEIEYKNVLQAEALNPKAIAQLGLIYNDEGRPRIAVPYLLKARELAPDNLEVRRKLGSLYLSFGKVKEARDEALYILERQPTDEVAPLILMEASMANADDTKVARERLQHLPAGAADGAPVQVALGIAEVRQRNLPAAEAAFKRATVTNPKFAVAYSALAGVYRAQKDLVKAGDALKMAADLAPVRSGKVLQYAQFKVQNGDKEGARKILENTVKQAPDYLPAQSLLAELAAADKRYDESAALVAKVLSRDSDNPDALLLNARLKLAKGEGDKAIIDLERMLKLFPNSPQALYYAGLAYATTPEKQKAIDYLTQAVKVMPSQEAILALAQLNLKKGDYSAVIVGLKPLIQQRPDNLQARMILAEAYRAQGNFEDALAIYRQSEKDLPNNANASFMSGLTLLQEKKLAEARTAFEEARRRSHGSFAAIEQLVYLDLREKKLDDAMKRVEAELAKKPASAPLHALLGRVCLVRSDVARAETELNKAIEIQPDYSAAYLLLAEHYVSSHQQEKALASVASVTAKNPNDLKALLLAGLIHDQQKNYPAAREAYEKLLAINPKFSPVLNNLAYLYSEHFNELDKAYDAAQKARELLPNEPHVADTFGWIMYKKGLYARALAQLEESADQLPDEPEVRYHLGVTQYALGQEEAAKVSLKRALEIKHDAAWADDARARLAILSMDAKSSTGVAVTTLEKALADRPGDPIILARLAAAYQRTGDFDKAVTAYQTVAKANPGNVAPLLSIAELYAGRNQSAKALEAARAARKLAPDDVEVAKSLGTLAFKMGDFSWAANLLQEAARREADNPDLLFSAAEALYSVGKLPEAEGLLRDALSPAGPAKPAGLTLNVSATDPLLTSAPRPEFTHAAEAKRFLELIAFSAAPTATPPAIVGEALQKDPAYVPALMALGAVQEQKPDPAAARQTYEKALARYPEFGPAKLRIAVLASAKPDFDQKAYDLALQARTAYPSNADAARALGILTYRKGDDYPRAITLLKQAVAGQPTDAAALYFLGLAQLQTKDNATAKKSLQKAIESGLKGEWATDAKTKLEGLK